MSTKGVVTDLGNPEELFYWGPSRATPLHMSDFMAAAEAFFLEAHNDSNLPDPPKTLVLFYDGKVVWLNNARDFDNFTSKVFQAYETIGDLEADMGRWKEVVTGLPKLYGGQFSDALLKAWRYTLFPEFALYGARSVVMEQLSRLAEDQRQTVWGTFIAPDKPTFIAQIDEELIAGASPSQLAAKYPWIQDGYSGVLGGAKEYFESRIKVLEEVEPNKVTQVTKEDRKQVADKFGLKPSEIGALDLTRQLAEFMDDRKAWMMQTRRLIKHALCDIEHGWLYDKGNVVDINEQDTKTLWDHYVDFKTPNDLVKGVTASTGGKHFVEGEVAVITSHTDAMANGVIMVVPATSPTYVPLMRKAKAVVTDHGGVMSHAAIVARELGIPCIVGTKQATKLLKTGDKIVLDMVRGEVSR